MTNYHLELTKDEVGQLHEILYRNCQRAKTANYPLLRKAVELLQTNPDDTICSSWHIDDVKSVSPDLAADQAREVLRRAKHNHDATIGINWEVLEILADDIREEAAKQAA